MTDKYAELRDALAEVAKTAARPVNPGDINVMHIIAKHFMNSAANPFTITALLKERDGYLDQHHRDSAELRSLCAERDALKSERDALAADVEDLKHDIGNYVRISTEQTTTCARCRQERSTPLRVDWMGGYVCLACIEKTLHGEHNDAVRFASRVANAELEAGRYKQQWEHMRDIAAEATDARAALSAQETKR